MHVSIYQICLAGIMTGVAILLGTFGTFSISGFGVYLVGIAIFLMPLVLKLPCLIIATIISVVFTDLINGYIAYTWITIIAYLSAILIIWVFTFFYKLKILFMIGTFIGCCLLVAIYYFLDLATFGKDWAIKDTIATSIEVAIVWPIINTLYLMFKMIPIAK